MAILCSGAEPFAMSNFGRGSPKTHFCVIILKSGHWPRSRCSKVFYVYFSSGSHLSYRSGRILAILVGSQLGFKPVKSESK